MKFSIVIIFLFFGVVSCENQKNDKNIVYLEKEAEYSLGSSFFIPRDICLLDSFLLIRDNGNSHFFSAFLKKDMEDIVATYGQRGVGPNEYIFPEIMRKKDNIIYVFDRALGRIGQIEIMQGKRDLNHFSYSENTLLAGLNNLNIINDSTFVGLTYANKSRYVVLCGDSLYNQGINYPKDGCDASDAQKSLVYQGILLKHPLDNRFVFTSQYGKILEILQLKNNELNLLFSRNEIYPQYKPIDNALEITANFTPNNITGCLCAVVSCKYIYILTSGKTIKDANKNFSNLIEVYDWEANYIKSIMTEDKLSSFCIDETEMMLYGITYDESEDIEPRVLLYKLDNL